MTVLVSKNDLHLEFKNPASASWQMRGFGLFQVENKNHPIHFYKNGSNIVHDAEPVARRDKNLIDTTRSPAMGFLWYEVYCF